MKNIKLFVLLFPFFFVFAAEMSAVEWGEYRDSVLSLDDYDLIRYYVPDYYRPETKTVTNTAIHPDLPDADFRYRTDHSLEIVDGPFPGTRAFRLDAGFFEASKPKIDKAFTVEMRIRKLGQGAERGNSGSTNGTLWGLGNGWDNGIRLTTSYPQQNLVFSIGRPEDPKARNLGGSKTVPDGVWQHVATTWDGKTMRIYVDGILYGITDYDGKLTEPSWGFRVGFNDAGVGSVKMDVAEVAVYRSALEPERILQHALYQTRSPDGFERIAASYDKAIDAVSQKDYATASKEIDELLRLDMPDVYRWTFRRFQAGLSHLAGTPVRSRQITAELLAETNLPENIASALIRSLITSDFIAPTPAASSRIYRQILDDKSIELDEKQRLAMEKCLAEALFVEGPLSKDKAVEARKILDNLRDREAALNREILKPQGVSGELSNLYRDYVKHMDFENEKEIQTVRYKVELAQNEGKLLRASPELRRSYEEKSYASADQYYVAPDGDADNPGTLEQPFGSLQQARDAIRKREKPNQAVVFVRGGVYPVTETFVLEKQDAGTSENRIHYQAYENEKPVFTGGISVKDFRKVDDPAVLKRLPEESRDKVYVAPVPGDVEFPPVAPRGYGKNGLGAAPFVELFIDDKPQQIARWPNFSKPDAPDPLKASEAAFVKTGKVHRGFFDTKDAGQPGIFEYSDPRHERWSEARDAMLFGYWGHLWAITSCRIEKIDPETKQIVLATNNPYGYRENMPYYAFNLLEEIDEPGEWYLDRENRKLYVYPPDGVDLNTAKVRLPSFAKNFFELKNVSDVSFIGLAFEEGAGNAGLAQGCENVNLIDCRFDRFGNWGLGVDGKRIFVQSCDFTALGGGGIDLKGGDIKTLSPGKNRIENCVVHDFSRVDRAYAPAVHLDGVGNRLAHNLFCDSPGHAIRVEGMEHTIEFNEVHSIVYESDDQSGIDIWGNPYIRGMVFRYNYWHHIGSGRDVAGQAGIRLDDMISGVLMYGNVFFRSSGGHFGGIQIHGGKDNVVDGNLMIDCKYAVSFSPWGEKRWLDQLENNFGKWVKGRGFDPDSEIYRTKYPDYAELKLNADRNFITRNAAIACEGFRHGGPRNVYLENVMLPWMSELFEETRTETRTETREEKPDVSGRVPMEARKIRSRISIPIDSPIYELLGIAPIPVDLMGPYVDAYRMKVPRYDITPYFVLE